MNNLQRSRRSVAWLLPAVAWIFLAGSAASVRAQDFDDDGITDEVERENGWVEDRSESPYIMRALRFTGGDALIDEAVEGTARYGISNWTVEVWVRPVQNVAGFVPLVSRVADGLVTFEVGLTLSSGQTRAYTRISREDAVGNPFYTLIEGASVPLDEWTHLAATFDNGTYILYKNGGEVARGNNTFIRPYVGAGTGELYLGSAGFRGDLMESRLWSAVRTPQQILNNYRRILLYSTEARENSFSGGAAGTYLGRPTLQPTVASPLSEDGFTYTRTVTENGVARQRITQKYTIEAWIKMEPGSRGGVVARRKVSLGAPPPPEEAWDTPPASSLVVGGDAPGGGYGVNYSLNILPDGTLQAEWWGESYVMVGALQYSFLKRRFLGSEVDLRDGQWHHIAVVGDVKVVTLYIDGAQDAQAGEYFYFSKPPTTPIPTMYTQYKTLGSILRIGQGGFDGILDEVMIWNDVRTPAQIIQDKTTGLTQAQVLAARAPMPAAPPTGSTVFADGGSAQRTRLVSYLIVDTTDPGATFVDDFANAAMPYRILPVPSGSEIIAGGRPPIVADTLGRAYARVLYGYFACSDGSSEAPPLVENYMVRNTVATAGVLSPGAAFTDLDRDDFADSGHLFNDSDNDGMPDWWETENGLNPLSDDAYDDPDGDGMPNEAEFRADTDPWSGDTDGDGNGDFFSWDTTAISDYRIFGERYTDFDGMADRWEVGSGLDPLRFDSHLDPDSDGWSSLAEFISGVGGDCSYAKASDPFVNWNTPVPTVTFTLKYNGLDATGPLRVFAYHSAAMDGKPDAVFTVPAGAYVFPLSVQRRGTWAGVAPVVTLTNVTATGALWEGPNWFFGFFDVNNNGTWNDDEPAGVAQGQPVSMAWGAVSDIVIGLTKVQPNSDLRDYDLAGYGRFDWPAYGSSSYRVYVRDTQGSQLLLRELAGPRTFFHEGDFRYAGITGLTESASWQWFVYVTNNTQPYASGNFGVLYPAAHVPPTPDLPNGSIFRYSKSELVWKTQDPQDTEFLVEVATDDVFSGIVYSATSIATFREKNGTHRYTLPIYAGDGTFTNGTYYWRVKGINKKSATAFSSVGSFRVDLTASAAGPFDIGGDIYYPGKVSNGTWIVQAFLSPGFGGRPEAQMRADNAPDVAQWPRNRTPFLLRGLVRGAYYVRAFLDQNGNDAPDVWETQGYVAGYCRYAPANILVPASRYNERLETMMRDTDNDKIADDWEYYRFGNLTTAGPGGSPLGYTSYLNGLLGLDDYQAYAATPMNVNPTDPDAHLADGVPLRIKAALGLKSSVLLDFDIRSVGVDETGRDVVIWGAVLGGTASVDPLNGRAAKSSGSVELGYQLQRSYDLCSWADAQGSAALEYDVLRNEFRYAGAPSAAGPVFYRYRVFWSE